MSTGSPTYDGKSALVQDRFIVNMTADENLTTTGQAVYIDFDWGVKATTGSNHAIFGVTLTKANSGNKIAVVTRGIVLGTAAGAVSSGYTFYAGTGTGRVAQATPANCATAAVPVRGLAMSSVSGAGSAVYLALF